MPLLDKKPPKGVVARQKAGQKPHTSISLRTADKKGNETVSSDGGSALRPIIDSDSDSDDKHSEVLPATDVTVYNAYDMGPAFGCKFPTQFIGLMVERCLYEKLKGT